MKSRKFSQRLFLATVLPRFAREQIIEARTRWRKQLDGDVRWVPPLQLFLSLRFLGELEVSKSKKLSNKLSKLCTSTSPIQLTIDKVGGSPNLEEATNLWLGLEASPELAELRNAIEQSCSELKISKDKKPFQPRIALSRTSGPLAVPELKIKSHLKGFKVKSISLFESRLGQNGPSYHVLRKFSLGG